MGSSNAKLKTWNWTKSSITKQLKFLFSFKPNPVLTLLRHRDMVLVLSHRPAGFSCLTATEWAALWSVGSQPTHPLELNKSLLLESGWHSCVSVYPELTTRTWGAAGTNVPCPGSLFTSVTVAAPAELVYLQRHSSAHKPLKETGRAAFTLINHHISPDYITASQP